ncbi:gliding motility protein [Chryseobacterium sp. Leaf405]|uniref:T9SS type B sorting domain-containing protein n=1 Tax=Chryseobacterium sp. Leaf405 TaxID=1736367 RepID=UPI0006F42B69|nr:gliding motility-associated C-terminal domain-containing protein [Chryseobacterium sp. Leaf405]KQT31115.1 gliding motility protein [Chryseobacterium sp. Leaf405]
MKRFLLSLVLVFLTINTVFAQRDTEHWFAPMMSRASMTSQGQAIYFSTDSTTPFPVDIYNNNVIIGTVTISKGLPATFNLLAATTNPAGNANLVTTTQSQVFTPITKGIYTKGTKPYYANLRLSITSHGEILVSKGKAGLGKKFYAAYAPITEAGNSLYNFTTGILATEDNTVVTVSGYSPTVVFSNGATGATTPSLSFTLQKGQSYIIEGQGTQPGNQTGFIGAKIESDKPISVTNGNFNGQFSWGPVGSSSDIIMDQAVPVNRLGNEFVLVKGNGNVTAQMEDALIIATENDTQVQINGGPVVATLNEGQFYRVNGPNNGAPANNTNYIDQGNGHSNMYVKTSKNAYVYQLLAGLATSIATLGYNYIPPLNCFLPRKIDEISAINDLNGSTNDIKLNILTETGATVNYSVNGGAPTVPTATEGPYPVQGTSAWVSYSIPGLSGNVTVTSTKAVTAGIAGGSGAVGYGGYFAGFSSVPVIAKKSGECVPGIVLEVDDAFEGYQWYLEGVAITGATQSTYTPVAAGNYTVKVTMGTCPPITTPIYKVYFCLRNTTANVNACATKIIVPTFSFTTQQTPVASTVTIITQPTHGTAVISANTGQITYTPTPGYFGPDTIVYQFCGNGVEFIDCERITLNLTVVPFVVTDATIRACQYNGKAYFDLTTATVTTYTPVIKKFYLTLNDLNANINEITNPTNYLSTEGTVYVKVTTDEGCMAIAKITLSFLPTPVVTEATLSECFLEIDETKASFDLTIAAVTAETPVTKKYYPTFVDASNGTNEILIASPYISGNGTVYIRVYNGSLCYAIAKVNLIVIPPKRSPLLVDQYICIDAKTTLDAGPGYQSYEWSTGATTQSISASVGDYWVILEDNNCFVKQIVSVKKAVDPVITEIQISNNSATVIVTGGKAPYQYAVDSPTNWQDSNVFTGLSRGQHTFYVKDAYNCTPINVEVTVPNLINAITPNGDNKNDVIDYSELAYKDNLTFVIYDRYGNKIFTGDKFNNYKWDGRHFDKKIVTGTYWYHINWNEPNKDKTPIKYSGWILVKNID